MLHVDMDAFFASVEERDNPHLKGRPVAVGGSTGKRGVVTAANYCARKYGLKAGMPSGQARKLCPHAVFLPVNGRKYVFVSAQIMAELESFSPKVRPLSVDEASLDISDSEQLFGGPEELGRQLKNRIVSRFGLPCTVGIGPNRLAAKMAVNMCKPDGLLVLKTANIANALAPLPVGEMVGIGKSTRAVLEQMGIFTLGQLAAASDYALKIRFGIHGPTLKKMARGEWAGRMKKDDERGPEEKSIGHQRTFAENITDIECLRAKLVGLSEMVGRRVRKGGYSGRVLTLTVRYSDFHTITHQTRLPEPTDDEETLIVYSWRLLSEVLKKEVPIRLLGLSLGEVAPKNETNRQLDLFNARRVHRMEKLHCALDQLRDRFGEKVVTRAMGGRYQSRSNRGSFEDIVPLRRGDTVRFSQ